MPLVSNVILNTVIIDQVQIMAVRIYCGILKKDSFGSFGDDSDDQLQDGNRAMPGYVPVTTGHTFSLGSTIQEHASRLDPQSTLVQNAMNYMRDNGVIHVEPYGPDDPETRVYIQEIYAAETYVAKRIRKLRNGKVEETQRLDPSDPKVKDLDATQFAAASHAVNNRITVISGRGGTGKVHFFL